MKNLWDDIELFGLVCFEDTGYLERLTGFWIDQETGRRHSDYYFPGQDELELDLITIDNPPIPAA